MSLGKSNLAKMLLSGMAVAALVHSITNEMWLMRPISDPVMAAVPQWFAIEISNSDPIALLVLNDFIL